MKKLSLKIISILFIIIGSLYFSKILITPNLLTQSNYTEVQEFDILTWQAQREKEIVNEYQSKLYTFISPFVILDPYEMNPLSALVLFESEVNDQYMITVTGHDSYSTYSYKLDRKLGRTEMPILGLYPNELNKVSIESSQGRIDLEIQTEPLPVDFQLYSVEVSNPEEMEPGMTLMIACFEHSYTAVIDQNAEVRAYFSDQRTGHGTNILNLSNGHLLLTGDEYKQIPYTMTSLWEINWLGKIYKEYEIPNAVHHDIFEMQNGDILAASNHKDMFVSGTREDVAIIVDRDSGVVKKSYDFRGILDENRSPFSNFDPGVINALNKDWLHMNAALYDSEHNWLIISSPIQSEVVAIDATTQEIEWILGPHDGYEGSSDYLSKYLLTPIGDVFEWSWGQHHPTILNDQDGDDNTMEILLFDNGQNRSFDQAGSLEPSLNYSRGVQYRINIQDKTVQQIWTYGSEIGNDYYSTFLGDIDELSFSGNRLITFGGHLTQNNQTVDKIISGVLENATVSSYVVEVNQDNTEVFKVKVLPSQGDNSGETYQSSRIQLVNSVGYETNFLEYQGERVGENYFITLDQDTKIPNIFFGDMKVSFNQLIHENNRLIVDGNLSYKNQTYLLSQAKIILRSPQNTFIWSANSGLNGRFFASIDLSSLPKSVYALQIAGGVKEGNDVLVGKLYKSYFGTQYKITIQ